MADSPAVAAADPDLGALDDGPSPIEYREVHGAPVVQRDHPFEAPLRLGHRLGRGASCTDRIGVELLAGRPEPGDVVAAEIEPSCRSDRVAGDERRLVRASTRTDVVERGRGRPVIVTGAARGIGRAIAMRFAAAGARIALLDRSPAIEETAVELGGIAATVDLANVTETRRAVAALVDRLSGCWCLVSNAGVFLERPLLETTPDRPPT